MSNFLFAQGEKKDAAVLTFIRVSDFYALARTIAKKSCLKLNF